MTDNERGLLLVEKERVEQSIRQLKGAIQSAGKEFASFGSWLQKPEDVRFKNAPPGVDDEQLKTWEHAFDWNDLSLDATAALVTEFRAKLARLRAIDTELKAV